MGGSNLDFNNSFNKEEKSINTFEKLNNKTIYLFLVFTVSIITYSYINAEK